MESDPPQTKDLLRAMGITIIRTELLIEQLRFTFKMETY